MGRAVYTRHNLIDAYEHLRYTIVTVKEDGDIKVRRNPFIFGGSGSNAPVSWLADPQIRCRLYFILLRVYFRLGVRQAFHNRWRSE